MKFGCNLGENRLLFLCFFIIAIAVPYRIGFDIDVPVGSFGFCVDVLIDLYFATDIFVNFRTACPCHLTLIPWLCAPIAH